MCIAPKAPIQSRSANLSETPHSNEPRRNPSFKWTSAKLLTQVNHNEAPHSNEPQWSPSLKWTTTKLLTQMNHNQASHSNEPQRSPSSSKPIETQVCAFSLKTSWPLTGTQPGYLAMVLHDMAARTQSVYSSLSKRKLHRWMGKGSQTPQPICSQLPAPYTHCGGWGCRGVLTVWRRWRAWTVVLAVGVVGINQAQEAESHIRWSV